MGRSESKKKIGVINKNFEILRFEKYFLRSKRQNISMFGRSYWILLATFLIQFFMYFHMALDLWAGGQQFKSYEVRQILTKNPKNLEKFQAKISDQLQSSQICLKTPQEYHRRL